MEKFEGAEHLDNWVEDKKRLGLLEQQTKSIGAHVKPVLEILGPLQKHANEIGELSKLGQYGLSDLIPVVGIERFVDSLKGFLKLDEPLNVYKLICTIEPNKTKRKKLYDEVMGEWKKELAETEKKGRSESIDRKKKQIEKKWTNVSQYQRFDEGKSSEHGVEITSVDNLPEMESLRKNKSFDFNRLKMELETINVHLGDLSIELTDYHRKEVLKNSVKLRQAEERLEAVMDEFLEIAEDYMRNDLDDYDPGEAFNLESENPDRLKKFKSSLKGTAEQERMIFSLYKNIVLLERKLMDHTIWI